MQRMLFPPRAVLRLAFGPLWTFTLSGTAALSPHDFGRMGTKHQLELASLMHVSIRLVDQFVSKRDALSQQARGLKPIYPVAISRGNPTGSCLMLRVCFLLYIGTRRGNIQALQSQRVCRTTSRLWLVRGAVPIDRMATRTDEWLP